MAASAIAPRVASKAATIPNVTKLTLIPNDNPSSSSEFSSANPCAIAKCSAGKISKTKAIMTMKLAIKAIDVVSSSAPELKMVMVNKKAPPTSKTAMALNWKLINIIMTIMIPKLTHKLAKAPTPLPPPMATIKTNKIMANTMVTVILAPPS